MSSFREQTRAVNSVLFEHWDPIGVRAMEGPDSEYENYVPQLIGLAQGGASDMELAEFLSGLESGAMGLSISPLAKRLDVASRIKREILRESDARDGLPAIAAAERTKYHALSADPISARCVRS